MCRKSPHWLALVLLLLSATVAYQGQDRSAERINSVPNYVIQPNDVLQVFVWKDETLSRDKILVRPDGRISLPLIQDMPAAGLNPVQLKQNIEEQLKPYMPNTVPNVTVIVDTIQSYQVYVMGKVVTPGVIRSATPLTVMQALATAGGFREFADQGGIVVIHGGERLKFNYDDFVKGKNTGQNSSLVSGDVVVVP